MAPPMVSGTQNGPTGRSDRKLNALSVVVLAAVLAVPLAVAGITFDLAECDTAVLEVEMTSPSGNTLHSGDILVEWNASGSAKDVAKYDLFINATGSTKDLLAEDLSGGSFTWDSTTYEEVDDATLAIRGTVDTDLYTCQDHDQVKGIDTDNSGPSVTLSSPSTGDLLEGDADITWSTDDEHPDTVDIDYSVDGGGSWSDLHDGTDDGSHTWSTMGLPEGADYQVRIRATDATGSTSSWASSGSFAIDNEAPDATVTDPPGGATIEGTVTVAWDASDLHLDCVDVQVRPSGVSWSTIETCNTTGETILDTTTLENGDHKIRVVATDALGNQNVSAAISVTVDNPLDTTDDTTDDGTTDDGSNDTDDGPTDGSSTESDSTSGDTTTGDADTAGDATGSEQDPVPGVAETLASIPVLALVVLVIGGAVLVGAGVGLWLRRRT